jgi:hypothetical protein
LAVIAEGEIVNDQEVRPSVDPAECRERAIEACIMLNSFFWDILAGDGLLQALDEHNVPLKGGDYFRSVHRMIASHLALVLARLGEFHRHYQRYLPEDCRLVSRSLFAEYERRGVLDLRNKVIEHIWDDETGRPMPKSAVDGAFKRLSAGNSVAFYAWMRNPGNSGDRETVIGQLAWIRDRLMQEHGLGAADLGLRDERGG